ncbi:WD repeat-containing protein 55-like protein [Hypsibius exemplaris]|uniref:WD repeat-containing protein 55 homolog n=1 Tax=Hypsibius exemplaris TaxID=2072580 RepID=A0A1W0WU58_HYPEX|nr:WD repeat-containing protein 55-like protein [Hypsibius exemplaris]
MKNRELKPQKKSFRDLHLEKLRNIAGMLSSRDYSTDSTYLDGLQSAVMVEFELRSVIDMKLTGDLLEEMHGAGAIQMEDEQSDEEEPEEEDADAATSADESDEEEDSDSWTSDEDDAVEESKKAPVSEEALAASIPKFIVECDVMPTDVQFCRSQDILATADMDGRVKIWKLSPDTGATLTSNLLPHRSPCRAVRFTSSGSLISVGKDKRICVVDTQQGTVTKTYKKAHDASIFCVLPFGDHGIVTGDDDGCVKVWDLRSEAATMEFHDNNECITAMACDDDEQKTLLATSGDGTLSAFNLRRKRLDLQSEAFSSELTSVAIIKGGSKVVCGTGDGALLVFKWGEWGYTLDQYPGREPMSIDAVEVLSPDRIYTASSDGNIRLVNMMPYRMLGYAGYHAMPFERISLSTDRETLASTSHDSQLRFWNVARFNDIPETAAADESDSDDDSDDDGKDGKRGGKRKKGGNSLKMPKKARAITNDFFSDL